jgi:hypothetical protein
MKLLPKEEWAKFVDTGEISDFRAQQIADKIKNNIVLSQQEISIYSVHAQCIEKLLKNKK